MHIDLFVLAAQIINFLVLVFLLKHFLYDRILGAMDAREAKIASQFEEAKLLKAEAMEAVQAYDEKNRELKDKAQELMNQAQKEADHEKNVLMDRVREEVDQVRQRWYETLAREKKAFLEELRRRGGSHVYETIRHVLADMADEELEDKMVDKFVFRLNDLSDAQQSRLQDSLKTAGVSIVVKSAFVLNQDQRKTVEDAIRAHAGSKVSIRYEATESIGAGIEMMAHGYKLSWSIEDYLTDLEEKFVRILHEEIPAAEQAI